MHVCVCYTDTQNYANTTFEENKKEVANWLVSIVSITFRSISWLWIEHKIVLVRGYFRFGIFDDNDLLPNNRHKFLVRCIWL